MLFFFAWGLATAVVAFLFPLSTLWPKTDLKGTLSIWSESWSSSRLPSSGFVPGSGNLSGTETAWPPLSKDAPIPLALPYDLSQLSSSLFYPRNSHTVILRKSPSALSAMGVFFLFLLEILCKPFSLPFVLRREALSPTKTSSSENNRSPRLSLNLLSVAFLPRSVTNELICLSGFWPTQLWQEVKKVLPGRDGHVLSLKDISVLLPSVN